MKENEMSQRIIGAALEVHRLIGPGLLEIVYETSLRTEFRLRDLKFQCQKGTPIIYKGSEVGESFRIDFLVEDCVVVEIKSVEKVLAVHKAQLLSYLRMTGHRLGLLINFNVSLLRRGIVRVVNNL